jgi:hypothetical protein
MRIDHGRGRTIESVAVLILPVQGLFAAPPPRALRAAARVAGDDGRTGRHAAGTGIPTLIAEIWRLLRQRKELARVIRHEIQSSAESGKLFPEEIGPLFYQSLARYLDRGMNAGVLRRRNPLAAAQCLIGTLWFFLLTKEVKVEENLYPLSDETVLATVTRMFLDGPAKAREHAPSHSAAAGGRHEGS